MTKTVLHNQSLLDFALQHCGTLAGIFEIALANDISIDSDLIPGTELIIPKGVVVDNDIVQFYKSKAVQPACGYSDNDAINEEIGIGSMIIGTNFIVA